MEYLVPVLVILFVSNMIQSVFSFGGALTAIPLLVLYMDVSSAVVLLTLMSFTLSAFIVVANWKQIDFFGALLLIVSSSLGIPAGVYFVVYADEFLVKIILAAVIIVFALSNLFNVLKNRQPDTKLALLLGFASGLFGGAYNISGPPAVMYGVLAGWSPDKFRTTMQSFAFKTNAIALMVHAGAGNVTGEVMKLYLWSLPVLLTCIFAGGYIHKRIPATAYKKVINLLLIALSLNLIFSLVSS